MSEPFDVALGSIAIKIGRMVSYAQELAGQRIGEDAERVAVFLLGLQIGIAAATKDVAVARKLANRMAMRAGFDELQRALIARYGDDVLALADAPDGP
jgi:hypothetical protein